MKRGASEHGPHRAREAARQRGRRVAERVAEMERANFRLEHLYQISKLLMSLSDLKRTMHEVIALIAQTIPLRTVLLTFDCAGMAEKVTWQSRQETSEHLHTAEAHARVAHDYLVRTSAARRAAGAPAPRYVATEVGAERGRYIVLPLVVTRGAIFGTLQVEGAGPFDENVLVFVNAVTNQLSVALERRALALATQREQELLASVGTVLSSYLDRHATLAAIARSVVPLFADVCIIDEVLGDGSLRRLEVVSTDQQKQRALVRHIQRFAPQLARRSPQAAAVESGQPLLFATVVDPLAEGIAHDMEHARAMQASGVRSMMVLPLQARGRTLGTLTLVLAESPRHYASRDLALAGEFASRVATAIDNVSLYEKAQQATRLRDNLLAVVSHDLKNPLGSILTTTSILLRMGPTDDRRSATRRQLELIKRAALRMNRLIEDLLDTASIEAGQLAVHVARLDLGPQIAEALEVLHPLAASKSLRLESEIPPQLPAVCGDAARLQQVLTNLLGNAIKFTRHGGAITVRARSSSVAAVVSVSDTGPGIPESDRPHLFDRFWRAKRTARLGTGLGLFIVKGIVEAHGGRVWVDSEVGVGSTFSLSLPLAPAAAATDSTPVHC